MQKLLLLLALYLLGTTALLAQNHRNDTLYGSYIDLSGTLIHEHADQDYNPSRFLSASVSAIQDYIPGFYYPPGEEAVSGKFIYTLGKKHFYFKEPENPKRKKIFPGLGWTVKIGTDSFIVADNFVIYGKLGIIRSAVSEASMLQFMGKTEHFAFFQYLPFSGRANYLVRRHNSSELISLPVNRRAFLEIADVLFKDYPSLLALIQNKEIDQEQVNQIIQFIRYTDALQSGKQIGYTSSWTITEDPDQQMYLAEVSRPESNWQLDFYKQAGQRLFTEQYSYSQPLKNAGEALWYYPETGIVRKKTSYQKESANTENQYLYLYHPNGNLHYTIRTDSYGTSSYIQVNSEEGTALLDVSGNGREAFYDSASQRTIHREFKGFTLKASWYIDSQNRKIYQLAKRNARLRGYKSYRKRFSAEINYPDADILAGTEGIVLVKFLLTPEDRIINCEIIQGLSHSIDEEVSEKLKMISPTLKFRSGKHDKEKVFQEVIMPVRFNLLRNSNSTYHYNHFWMHQMMHQQMQMNVTPPPSFSRF